MKFSVPDKTSINSEEFKPADLTIPFAPELIDFILEDKKMTTYRLGLKYDTIETGDKVDIQNSDTKAIVSRAIVTGKKRVTFKALPLSTGTHEAYRDKEHQRAVLSGYYNYIGRPIEDDDTFLIFDFKLI